MTANQTTDCFPSAVCLAFYVGVRFCCMTCHLPAGGQCILLTQPYVAMLVGCCCAFVACNVVEVSLLGHLQMLASAHLLPLIGWPPFGSLVAGGSLLLLSNAWGPFQLLALPAIWACFLGCLPWILFSNHFFEGLFKAGNGLWPALMSGPVQGLFQLEVWEVKFQHFWPGGQGPLSLAQFRTCSRLRFGRSGLGARALCSWSSLRPVLA